MSCIGLLDMQNLLHAVLELTYDGATGWIVSLPLPVMGFIRGLHPSTEVL